MYSIVRHPIYVGNFVIWLGVALYCGIWWMAALFVLTFWLYYERIMFAEEEFLRQKFGDRYLQWAERTPAFIPRTRGWTPARLPFSLRSVLRREYSSVLAIVSCFFSMEVYDHVFLLGQWSPEPYWCIIFATTAVCFLLVRAIKWRTRLLEVEPRMISFAGSDRLPQRSPTPAIHLEIVYGQPAKKRAPQAESVELLDDTRTAK